MSNSISVVIEKPIEVEGLAQKIWEARRLCRRTHTVLCEEAGISRQYWTEIEKGKRPSIPLRTLRNIERALGVDFGVEA
jgi:transcriptional regulator with XRE-family HTH domain